MLSPRSGSTAHLRLSRRRWGSWGPWGLVGFVSRRTVIAAATGCSAWRPSGRRSASALIKLLVLHGVFRPDVDRVSTGRISGKARVMPMTPVFNPFPRIAPAPGRGPCSAQKRHARADAFASALSQQTLQRRSGTERFARLTGASGNRVCTAVAAPTASAPWTRDAANHHRGQAALALGPVPVTRRHGHKASDATQGRHHHRDGDAYRRPLRSRLFESIPVRASCGYRRS